MQKQASLTGLMARATRLYKAKVNATMQENGIDLSSEMCGVLLELQEKDGQHLQQLADIFKKDKGGMAKIIKSLERRSLISRMRDKGDRRQKHITLTSKGFATCDEINPIIRSLKQSTLNHMAEDDLETMRRALLTMVGNLE